MKKKSSRAVLLCLCLACLALFVTACSKTESVTVLTTALNAQVQLLNVSVTGSVEGGVIVEKTASLNVLVVSDIYYTVKDADITVNGQTVQSTYHAPTEYEDADSRTFTVNAPSGEIKIGVTGVVKMSATVSIGVKNLPEDPYMLNYLKQGSFQLNDSRTHSLSELITADKTIKYDFEYESIRNKKQKLSVTIPRNVFSTDKQNVGKDVPFTLWNADLPLYWNFAEGIEPLQYDFDCGKEGASLVLDFDGLRFSKALILFPELLNSVTLVNPAGSQAMKDFLQPMPFRLQFYAGQEALFSMENAKVYYNQVDDAHLLTPSIIDGVATYTLQPHAVPLYNYSYSEHCFNIYVRGIEPTDPANKVEINVQPKELRYTQIGESPYCYTDDGFSFQKNPNGYGNAKVLFTAKYPQTFNLVVFKINGQTVTVDSSFITETATGISGVTAVIADGTIANGVSLSFDRDKDYSVEVLAFELQGAP